MDSKELKEYIFRNNLIHTILTNIGCHSFTPYANEIRCALPDDDDSSKVSVFKDENLSVRVFTKGETIYGSIYDLIMYIDKCEFKIAYKKCLSLLGLSSRNFKTSIPDHLSFFKGIKKHNHQTHEQIYYDLSILNKYSPIPHIDLIKKDGIIDKAVIDKYLIRFDGISNRIIFPHLKYNDKTKIAGIIGRTVNPAYESLKIPKYFSMEGIKYEKTKNLYGLSLNINNIKNEGKVIIYEAEKSCLKSDMFGLPIGVSVGCHDISDFQKKLVISLGVEIIIAFDKGVDQNHIHNIAKELNKYQKVSIIEDKYNLTKERDSPCDRGYKKLNYLYRNRTVI